MSTQVGHLAPADAAKSASTYSHVSFAVSTLFAPVFLQSHTFTFCIWLFLRIIETVDAHSGYRLPFAPWQIFDSLQVLVLHFPSIALSKIPCDSMSNSSPYKGRRPETRFSPFQLFGQLRLIFFFLGLVLWHRCSIQGKSTWKGDSRLTLNFPSFVAFSCCSMHLLMHLKQIAFGTGPAVGVRGGSIVFSGCSSEHVVAFQQLIPCLAPTKTIRFSCKSCNSNVSEEVPIATALQLLKCKGSVTLRWTRATS